MMRPATARMRNRGRLVPGVSWPVRAGRGQGLGPGQRVGEGDHLAPDPVLGVVVEGQQVPQSGASEAADAVLGARGRWRIFRPSSRQRAHLVAVLVAGHPSRCGRSAATARRGARAATTCIPAGGSRVPGRQAVRPGCGNSGGEAVDLGTIAGITVPSVAATQARSRTAGIAAQMVS